MDEPRLASEVLLAQAAGKRRIDLYAHFDEVLAPEQVKRFREWIGRAAAHEPIAYLVGEKEFFSLAFTVTPDVLIPRPDTETLVECVIDHCRQVGLERPRLLDLGTGSGCVAVALLCQLPGASAVATDISGEALNVARINAKRHGVCDRLTLAQVNGLALPQGLAPEGGFDVLVSNPPYIAAAEMKHLPPSVREYEPALALTDNQDGLSFYRSIAENGRSLLAPGGVVVVEIGDGMAKQVLETIPRSGTFVHDRTVRDRVVGQERVLMFLMT